MPLPDIELAKYIPSNGICSRVGRGCLGQSVGLVRGRLAAAARWGSLPAGLGALSAAFSSSQSDC